MSSIIKFFLATDDEEAAGMPPGSVAGGPETVELGNSDSVRMLNDWEAAFLARDADESLDGGCPEALCAAAKVPITPSARILRMPGEIEIEEWKCLAELIINSF